eukprot:jgi/Psemu1/815/gm1.815_g
MVQTIPPRKSKAVPAPQTWSVVAPAQDLWSGTRSSSTDATTATTTTQRRSVAARNSSLSKNPYNKKKDPPPPPSGSPTTTAGKRKKKRTRRTLPLSCCVLVGSLAPGAPSTLVASLAPDPVDPLVAPVAPSVAPASPSVAPASPLMPDPVDPSVTLVAPVDGDESTLLLSDSESDAYTIQDYSRDLGIAVEQLQLPPAVTFVVPTALACNNIEATPAPLPQEFTLASILTALEGNKLSLGPNTEKTRGLTFNTTAHKKKKKRLKAEFFQLLAAHPQAAPLADLIPDLEIPSLMKHRFFIQCRAPLYPNKLSLVNYCMLIYSMNLYKMIYCNMDLLKDAKLYAEAQYHSNSVNQQMKCLFAIFGKEHTNYSLATGFDHPGGFQAYFKKNFSITGEHRKSYSELPNKAQFDPKWFSKWWEASCSPQYPLDPFNNIEHYVTYVWCAMENIMTKWATHGCKEPTSLGTEDFETGLIQEGEFAGIPFARLKEIYSGQKNCALSLKHNVIDEENTWKRTLPCPHSSDALSTYQITIKLLSMVPDDCQNSNRIFRKPASKKQIKASVYLMNFWFKLLFGVVTITLSGVLPMGKRHEALSKVANASVCPSLIKGMGGHASIDITTRYIKPNQQAIDAAVCAKHGPPSKIRAPAPRAPFPAHPAPRAPSPTPAPATCAPAPASPAEESQAPAPFLDESPLFSIQHSSFGDHSKDSVSSDLAAGALGLMAQQFEVPKESPPAFPSNISFGTGEEPSPVPISFTERTNHQWREHDLHHDIPRLVFGGRKTEYVTLDTAFHKSYSVKKSKTIWRHIGIAPFTRKCLRNRNVAHAVTMLPNGSVDLTADPTTAKLLDLELSNSNAVKYLTDYGLKGKAFAAKAPRNNEKDKITSTNRKFQITDGFVTNSCGIWKVKVLKERSNKISVLKTTKVCAAAFAKKKGAAEALVAKCGGEFSRLGLQVLKVVYEWKLGKKVAAGMKKEHVVAALVKAKDDPPVDAVKWSEEVDGAELQQLEKAEIKMKETELGKALAEK